MTQTAPPTLSYESPAITGETPVASTPRLEWVDLFKGLAIILVVTGHVIGGLRDSGIITDRTAATAVYRWIYTFHMPAFFFVSGLFAAKSLRRGPGPFIRSKAATLLYPYAVWTAIQWVCHESLAGLTNSKPDPLQLLKMVYEPYMNLWFLYALFLVFAAYAMISSAGNRPWLLVLLGLMAWSVAVGWWPLLNRAAAESVYFALGIAASSVVIRAASKLPSSAGVAAAAAAAALLAGAIWFDLDSYPPAEIPLAVIGIVGCYGLAVALDRFRAGRILILCGACSLEIYLMHGIISVPTRIGLSKVLGIRSAAAHLVTGLTVGVGVPMLVAAAVRRWKIRGLFTWPF